MADNFWSSDFAGETVISDPKRKFRFAVYIPGLASVGGTDDDTTTTNELWYAKTATKPSFQIATAEHKYLNHTFFYPGTVTWQDVTLTLVDPTSPDIASTFGAIMTAAGYAVPATESGLVTMTKSSMAGALKEVIVAQLKGDGSISESWTLKNALITEMKFGDLEYGADDLTELSLTLKYDWAVLNEGSPDSLEEYFGASDQTS